MQAQHTQSLFDANKYPIFCDLAKPSPCTENSRIDLSDGDTLKELKKYDHSAVEAAIAMADLDANGHHIGVVTFPAFAAAGGPSACQFEGHTSLKRGDAACTSGA